MTIHVPKYDLGEEYEGMVLVMFDASYRASYEFGLLLIEIEEAFISEYGNARGLQSDVAHFIAEERGIAFQSAKNIVSESMKVARSGGTVPKRARGASQKSFCLKVATLAKGRSKAEIRKAIKVLEGLL
jgi:hypothetical protein